MLGDDEFRRLLDHLNRPGSPRSAQRGRKAHSEAHARIGLRFNLTAYFQGDTQGRAFNQIFSSPAPQGYLIVGSHERLPPHDYEMHRHEACQWIYQFA
jgi:hypothetical protein